MDKVLISVAIGIFIFLGMYTQAWFLTSFRAIVGNIIFFAWFIVGLGIYIAIIYLIGLDYSWSLKLFIILTILCLHLFVANYLYKKRKKAKGGD